MVPVVVSFVMVASVTPPALHGLPLPDKAFRQFLLRDSHNGYISSRMTRIFDMDDRARLPWRFFGATLTVLARL